jgi:hypothetical protein
MPESLHLDSGEKVIWIENDPDRALIFNPSDILFAEKFYQLIQRFDVKQREYSKRYDEIDKPNGKTLDSFENMPEVIGLVKEFVAFMYGEIDELFGEGTSEMVFQGNQSLGMIQQFFDGLLPFIQNVRQSHVKKYTEGNQK